MTIWQAIVLGIVEGITEFLPVSSTGHLVLVSNLLGIAQSEFVKSFEVIIQLGAILAVGAIYAKYLWENKNIWPKIIVAFIPSAIFGLLFYKFIKTFLLGNQLITLLALALGGLVLIFSDRLDKFITNKPLDIKKSLIIGCAQVVSMIPGVSRSAATIIGGLSVGLSRQESVKFSFLLAIPTMLAATGLDLLKTGWNFNQSEWLVLIVGFIAAFITAWVTIKWLVTYVQNNSLQVFGWYRLALVALILVLEKVINSR